MMTKTSNATAAHSVIREIVYCAENIAAQVGVGSSETAGVIVSFLAERPSLMPAFMDGTLSPVDIGMLDHHNGVLSWCGQDGGIYRPDPSKARFPAPAPETLTARTAYDDIGFGVKVRALEWDEHGSAQALGLRYEVWLRADRASEEERITRTDLASLLEEVRRPSALPENHIRQIADRIERMMEVAGGQEERIREDEREACARVAEQRTEFGGVPVNGEAIAARIRLRGYAS